MKRLNILGLLLGMLCIASEAIHAQSIRLFVKYGNGLYEILENRLPRAGGAFIYAPTRETIPFPGGQLPVLGYTGQAQRGELFIGRAEGTGSGTLTVTFQDERTRKTVELLRPTPIKLPASSPLLTVPSDQQKDNLTATVKVGTRVVSRRLPLGRR
ncbi:MAG: hypothetical protein WCR07_09785 [Verrucomicrobiota bacterium]|jgi:hypothetical protein